MHSVLFNFMITPSHITVDNARFSRRDKQPKYSRRRNRKIQVSMSEALPSPFAINIF
jgi:hypothetical protein